MEQLLTKTEMPEWFYYPREFLRIVEQNLLNFDPWIILEGERLRVRFGGLKKDTQQIEILFLLPIGKIMMM